MLHRIYNLSIRLSHYKRYNREKQCEKERSGKLASLFERSVKYGGKLKILKLQVSFDPLKIFSTKPKSEKGLRSQTGKYKPSKLKISGSHLNRRHLENYSKQVSLDIYFEEMYNSRVSKSVTLPQLYTPVRNKSEHTPIHYFKTQENSSRISVQYHCVILYNCICIKITRK